MPALDVVAVDLDPPFAGVQSADLVGLPFEDGAFDGVVCVHVLEHIDDDEAAIAELVRVLAPGGWLLVGVPLMLDDTTFEDPSITTPHERKRAFGEPDHRRVYGIDLVDRLRALGLEVDLKDASQLAVDVVERFGLRRDEHLLVCRGDHPRGTDASR